MQLSRSLDVIYASHELNAVDGDAHASIRTRLFQENSFIHLGNIPFSQTRSPLPVSSSELMLRHVLRGAFRVGLAVLVVAAGGASAADADRAEAGAAAAVRRRSPLTHRSHHSLTRLASFQ